MKEIDCLVNFFQNESRKKFFGDHVGILARKQAETAERYASQPGRGRRAIMAHILAVAERSFAESGFSGTTMERLAQAAGLPKANLHYYFGTKEQLYRGVLENILALWLDDMNTITPERPPAEALAAYIRAKLAHTRSRPHASKVFAAELLHGAPHLRRFLSFELRRRVTEKARVIRGWIDRGLMEPIDPIHLFFNIWAMTQTYADFEVQVRAVLGVNRLGDAEFAAAEQTIIRLVLKGCGLNWQEGKP